MLISLRIIREISDPHSLQNDKLNNKLQTDVEFTFIWTPDLDYLNRVILADLEDQHLIQGTN